MYCNIPNKEQFIEVMKDISDITGIMPRIMWVNQDIYNSLKPYHKYKIRRRNRLKAAKLSRKRQEPITGIDYGAGQDETVIAYVTINGGE